MKLRIYFLLIFASLLFSADAFAQVNRNIGQGQYRRNLKKKDGNEKVKAFDYAGETSKFLTKELKLDDFQAAAVREIVSNETGALLAITQDPDMTENEREDKGREVTARIDEKILKLLSPEQAEKYKELQKKKTKS